MKKILLSLGQCCIAAVAVAQSTTPYNTIEYVDINSIKAATLVHGDMWWDPATQTAGCEFPKGSGKNIQFGSSLWIGGYDSLANLHVSAQTYRQNGNDFWPGPLDSATGAATATVSQDWAKIWKVNRTTIDSFKALSSNTIANTPAVILQWPAKGNVNATGNNNATLQINEDMAPFIDVDSDGVYNALSGDYPKIKGDQLLWWVFNDNGITHTETGGVPLKLQISASAYAYNMTGDLQRIIYYEYLIKNKSGVAYDSVAMGLRTDGDLGYFFDDYIGFDSVHRMGIQYNGPSTDGTGQPGTYDTLIPITGVSLIQLPGDSATVIKPAGSFMYYNNDNTAKGNPSNAVEYNYYLRSRFKDGTHLKNNNGNDVAYAYPGNPLDATQWSECMSGTIPGDRRFIISSNKFQLQAGATQKIAMALITTTPDTGNTCHHTNFSAIEGMADSAWYYYYNPPQQTTAVHHIAGISKLNLYPNPAETVLNIERPTTTGKETVLVYDALGRYISLEINRKNNLLSLDIKNLPNGVYTIQYRSDTGTAAGVFVKK